MADGAATQVRAEVLPLSDIFLVHEPMPTADQSHPHVAALPRGGFLAAWTSECEDRCPSGVPLVGRAFDARGTPRYDARAFTADFPTGARDVQFALLGPLRSVVAWSNPDRDGSDDGLVAAIVSRNFREVQSEFPVNLRHTQGSQRYPTIASTGRGFVIAWYDFGDDLGVLPRISAQRFDTAGNRLGDEIDLAVEPDDYGLYPEAAALRGSRSGDVVIVWESIQLEVPGASFDVAAKFIGRDGRVSERRVLTTLEAHEGNPSVAATDDGIIVAWVGFANDQVDVFARRFDNDGLPVGEAFRVNTFTRGPQVAPLVATSLNGNFVVLWTSGDRVDPALTQDGDSYGLYGQAFSASGSRIGPEFQVSTRTRGRQGAVPNTTTAAFLNDMDFVVLWNDRQDELNRVYGRRFRLSPLTRLCGDSVGSDLTVRAADALRVLRAVVGRDQCDTCRCDIDASGHVTAADAQAALLISVGSATFQGCPACE